MVTMKDMEKANDLLKQVLLKNQTVILFEMLQESLEDAYMKVMK